MRTIVSSSSAWLQLILLGGWNSRRGIHSSAFAFSFSFSGTSSSLGGRVVGGVCTRMSASSSTVQDWGELQTFSDGQTVGHALNEEASLRVSGRGSAHVQSTLRLFDSSDDDDDDEVPKITLYRDHAGWCPYCQKTMLLIEEKEIPINIGLVPMRSYGDKPREFLQKVPNGLLPALGVEQNGREQIITESSVIMELLDRAHPPSDGYKAMLPNNDDTKNLNRYNALSNLERELFSWWCTFMFRPEGGPAATMGGGIMSRLTGGGSGTSNMSGSMKGFLDCLSKVDKELTLTKGPWFFDDNDHPTMIDFVYVSHVERMLASCAFWKGLNLRDDQWKQKYPGINAWLDAFEQKEHYLAFKSDYYTHVMDIPPQYGPSYNGGMDDAVRKQYASAINGQDDSSWHLPLSHDDPLQPLYRGLPLPQCVLNAVGMTAPYNDHDVDDDDETQQQKMAKACRQMAGWKLASNGKNVAKFAARGGTKGANNPRKNFGAELADPYANHDPTALPHVDSALRIVCTTLLDDTDYTTAQDHCDSLQPYIPQLKQSIPSNQISNVKNSLAYLRDRIGVPRDLPLASARHLRAHLNWAIDSLL